jgi:hypothetical protein
VGFTINNEGAIDNYYFNLSNLFHCCCEGVKQFHLDWVRSREEEAGPLIFVLPLWGPFGEGKGRKGKAWNFWTLLPYKFKFVGREWWGLSVREPWLLWALCTCLFFMMNRACMHACMHTPPPPPLQKFMGFQCAILCGWFYACLPALHDAAETCTSLLTNKRNVDFCMSCSLLAKFWTHDHRWWGAK